MGKITKGQCLRIFNDIAIHETAKQEKLAEMLGDDSGSYIRFTERTMATFGKFLEDCT